MTAGMIQLGPQPDGSVIIAIWLLSPHDRRAPELCFPSDGKPLLEDQDFVDLPKTARGRSFANVYRVPHGFAGGDAIVVGGGAIVQQRGSLGEFDGNPISDMPADWFRFLAAHYSGAQA